MTLYRYNRYTKTLEVLDTNEEGPYGYWRSLKDGLSALDQMPESVLVYLLGSDLNTDYWLTDEP